MNVTVYVNGKRVTKEEIEKIEIHNEEVKRIFAQRLSHSSDNNKNGNITQP